MRHRSIPDRRRIIVVRKIILSDGNDDIVLLRSQKTTTYSTSGRIVRKTKFLLPRQTPVLLMDAPPGGASHCPSLPSTPTIISAPVTMATLPTEDPFAVVSAVIKFEATFLMDSDTANAALKGVRMEGAKNGRLVPTQRSRCRSAHRSR